MDYYKFTRMSSSLLLDMVILCILKNNSWSHTSKKRKRKNVLDHCIDLLWTTLES